MVIRRGNHKQRMRKILSFTAYYIAFLRWSIVWTAGPTPHIDYKLKIFGRQDAARSADINSRYGVNYYIDSGETIAI